MGDTAMIAVSELSVSVDGTMLLAPTSFELGRGRVLSVTGANGAGKTTLLRAIAGRVAPSSGTVTVAGAAPDDRSPAFRSTLASMLFPPPFARSLTVREHIELVATSWGLSLADARERTAGLLDEFGIGRLSARFPHELSSGQGQLFALAVTLVRPFDVLLLDEPEQRLDVDRLAMVGALLRARADSGASIVLASHSEVLVEQLGGQTLLLTEEVHERGD